MSPPSSSRAVVADMDPLVSQTTKKIAHVINDFKRELDKRDGTWAQAHREFELALETQTFVLTLVPDEFDEDRPVTVQARLKVPEPTNDNVPLPSTNGSTASESARRESEAQHQPDFNSGTKRKSDAEDEKPNKRPRPNDEQEDVVLQITKADLDDLLSKLTANPKDTIESITHVQRLLRRFEKDRQEERNSDSHDSQNPRTRHSTLSDKMLNVDGMTPGNSFPGPSVDLDDQTAENSAITDTIKGEAKLISTQIKWVEDCRRVAADIHDKREEMWRTSSAGFHDRQRQDRESFQNRMSRESCAQSQTLNQILNEVRQIGVYAQSMKWEVPASHLTASIRTSPAFPTQSALVSPNLGGSQRPGSGNSDTKQPDQR
jgi:hypothetical protein